MEEIRYFISDASKKVDVETHVLRYWEEELGISIPRNKMGHRYYTDFHIRLFCQVKKLKEKGYQLKAIKSALEQVMAQEEGIAETAEVLEEDMSRTLQENLPEHKLNGRRENQKVNPQENQEANLRGSQEVNLWEKQRMNQQENQQEDSLKEKDGQVDMKNRGRERKRSSSWERRNPASVIHLKEESQRSGTQRMEGRQNDDRQDEACQNNACWNEVGQDDGGQNISRGDGRQQDMPDKHSAIAERNYYAEGLCKANAEPGIISLADRSVELRNENEAGDWDENGIQNKNGIKNENKAGNEFGIKSKSEAGNEFGIKSKSEAGKEFGMKNESEAGNEYEMKNETKAGNGYGLKDESGAGKENAAKFENETEGGLSVVSQEERMVQFQQIMDHIIGRALAVNNEKLSQDISGLVNERIAEELEDLMRIRDEREEERYRQIDEIIRSCQRDSLSKAEAAAAKIPFFKRKRFGRNGKLQ